MSSFSLIDFDGMHSHDMNDVYDLLVCILVPCLLCRRSVLTTLHDIYDLRYDDEDMTTNRMRFV